MKTRICFILSIFLAIPLWAKSQPSNLLLGAVIDFVAPSESGTTGLDGAAVGSIIWDTSAGNFKGKAADSSWVPLSTSAGSAWYVDANEGGSGVTPDLGTSTVSSFTGITDAGLVLTQNGNSATTYISCSSTNDSTGSTCAAGTPEIGIAFTIPAAGQYRACATFDQYVLVSSGTIVTGFELVETGNTSQSVVSSGHGHLNSDSNIAGGIQVPFHLCGIFDFSTVSKKTLRLFYQQGATGSIGASEILADQNGPVYRDIHWEVTQIK